MKLIIMRGAPGIGKSTYIKNNYPNSVICSADHFFLNDKNEYIFNKNLLGIAHKTCYDKVESYLKDKDNLPKEIEFIVVDNTNTRLREINPFVKLAEQYSVPFELITLIAPIESFCRRNIHDVGENTVREMHERIMQVNANIPKHWPHKIIDVF